MISTNSNLPSLIDHGNSSVAKLRFRTPEARDAYFKEYQAAIAGLDIQPEPMTGIMLVKCAWCKADMGTKACVAKMDGQTSHGMCPDCAAKIEADVREYRASVPNDAAIGATVNIPID